MMEIKGFGVTLQLIFDLRQSFLFVNKMCEIFKIRMKGGMPKRDIFAGHF